MAGDPTGIISHADEFHRGHAWKRPVRVATTANITISTALNNGDTLDGVTLAAGDRVLVKDQSTGSQNGLYIVGASPARAFDMDQDLTTSVPAEEVMGAIIYVIAGTTNGGTLWKNTNTTAPTLGTTALTFSQITLASIAASAVTVADSAGWFLGSNAETVLAEIGGKLVGYTAHGNTGSTETFDALTAWHSATLNANCTFTFTGATSGVLASMVLELLQDGTGSRLVTWPGSVVWPGGVAPTLSTAAGATDILTFFSRDGGTTWYGFITGGSSTFTLTVKDEGGALTTAATSLDFVGAGVTASGSGAGKTITIPGGATASDANIWRPLMDGSGAVVTDGSGQAVMAYGPA